jgi:hypothetical protein
VGANLIASAAHFADNVRFFDAYPEPAWISDARIVDGLWFVITPILVAGWWLYRRGRTRPGRLLLGLYGVLGSTVLGHYRYGPLLAMSARMHALVWFEAAAAIALLVWAVGARPASPISTETAV